MPDRPDATIAGVRRSHARLLATVAGLDDATAGRPSLLPGWDVAMLVTHLARNADSHTYASEGARVGERRARYPSVAARDEGIEAGRGLSAAAVRADLEAAVDRLDQTWATLPPEAWSVVTLAGAGDGAPMTELPLHRWREAELHHLDLGLGFGVDDLDAEFVAAELDHWVAGLGARLPAGTSVVLTATDLGRTWTVGPEASAVAVERPAAQLLAWITGRGGADLPVLGPWEW